MNYINKLIFTTDFLGHTKEEIYHCGQDFRRVNLNILSKATVVTILFAVFIGILPFFFFKKYADVIAALAYIIFVFCIRSVASKMKKESVITNKVYYAVHTFNICTFLYAIYIGMTVGKDNSSVVFIVLIATLQSFYILRPRTSFFVTVFMSLIFCIASFFYKEHIYFFYDFRNILLGLFISVPMNYITTKSRVDNLIEHNKTKERYAKLYDDYSKDGLTGVFSKSVINEIIASYCNRCAGENINIFIALIDVDFFKQYNDTYGHLRGDDVLSQIGDIFKSIAVSHKVNCGRVGGEEFVVVGKVDNKLQALRLCETIKVSVEALSIEHKASAVAEYVTVSVGLSFAEAGSKVISGEIYEQADKALYVAKKGGRNRVEMF